MLEGLEVAEILLSTLERTKRLDAEYFQPTYLRIAQILSERPSVALTEIAAISDGNHFSISEEFTREGTPYYRGQDVVGHFFIEQASPVFIPEKAYNLPHMVRSHLKCGDVLLSIVGTVGEVSLVASDTPATCSCKLAILRPHDVSPEYLAVFLRSAHGRSQIKRLTRGAVQMGLLLEDMDQIKVARLSPSFERRIVQAVLDARHEVENAQGYAQLAEQTLLRALGLENWQPPEPQTYTRPASEAFTAGRLDAEHYQEKFYAARRRLTEAGAQEFIPLADLLVSLTNGHTPLRHDLRIGEVPFLCAEHVSDFEVDFASGKRILSKHHQGELSGTALRDGDVLLTIKGRVGNFAVVENMQGPVNINQDVALLRFNDNLPLWYKLAFLNSSFGKLQTEQICTGGINPFLGLSNVRLLKIPRFAEKLMIKIGEQTRIKVHEARSARNQAHALLEAAKRAVEIAIEENEAAALRHLDAALHTNS